MNGYYELQKVPHRVGFWELVYNDPTGLIVRVAELQLPDIPAQELYDQLDYGLRYADMVDS